MRVLYILAFVLWNAYSVVAQDFGSLTGKVENRRRRNFIRCQYHSQRTCH